MSAFLGVRVAALATVLAATATLTTAAPSSAAPPVAVDDYRWMYPGDFRLINVLRNDTDPEGDELEICRVGEVPETDGYVEVAGGSLFVATPSEATEDLVITYYACDFETLVPATLTISFREIQPVKIAKLDRPGRLRVTNDNEQGIRVLYGSFRESRPDGRVRVLAHDSVVIRVHRHRIDWVAYIGRAALAGIGHVRGIDLPARDLRDVSPRIALSRAEARLWAAQR